MDIHHLKIFVSVYKNKSFTKASEALHISQPTISEHIKNLESSLKDIDNGIFFGENGMHGIFTLDNLPSPLAFDHAQVLDDYRRFRETGEVTPLRHI